MSAQITTDTGSTDTGDEASASAHGAPAAAARARELLSQTAHHRLDRHRAGQQTPTSNGRS